MAQIQYNYKDTTVIVTGGTRGIGAGITRSFISAGAKVIATYARNDDAAKAFQESLGANADNLILKKFDVSNATEVEEFFNWIDESEMNFQVLVNNSGIRKDNIIASMGVDQWDDVININLRGTYLMTKQAILRMMRKRYGRIINMSSVGGQLGLNGQANYAASKAAQVALSKSVSKEVGKRGITINNVLPGFIETELIQDLPAEQVKEYKSQVPAKRFGTTKEVANTVLFLASEEAAYINAAEITIAGGL